MAYLALRLTLQDPAEKFPYHILTPFGNLFLLRDPADDDRASKIPFDERLDGLEGVPFRVSFPALGNPCSAGACPGAIWPQGKGDVLDGLGLLAGTNNRHLNGVWQLFDEDAPPPPSPAAPPPSPSPPLDDNWQLLLEKLSRIEKLIRRLPVRRRRWPIVPDASKPDEEID